jgi:hypothetical protein
VLQQEKLHVLEKEMRQRKQQQEQLLHDVENVVLPQQKVPVKDDAPAVQRKDVPVVLKEDELAAPREDDPQVLNEEVPQEEEDVVKTSKPFFIFFLLKPLVQ